MKRLFLVILILQTSQLIYAQTNIEDYNKIIIKSIEKNITRPDYRDIDSSGLALVKISKINDSIILKSIYHSSARFNLENDEKLIRNLSKSNKDKIPNNYEVILPLYRKPPTDTIL